MIRVVRMTLPRRRNDPLARTRGLVQGRTRPCSRDQLTTAFGALQPIGSDRGLGRSCPIAVICPTQKFEAASTYFFRCSLTRVTSWVGLSKRSATSSQIIVVTL